MQDPHSYDPSTHLYSSHSVIHYSARINDTNSSISCQVRQTDKYGSLLYTQDKVLRIMVDPLPPPLAKVERTGKYGILAGVGLSILFFCLILVLGIVFICRRDNNSKSDSTDNSDIQVKPM